ncbi:MAG: S41 family peptidase [Bacteroidia bacterium]|jgi:carboxyl-terminal processing protease|nr:S41 family peptidase [Bacteroidia bacterium]
MKIKRSYTKTVILSSVVVLMIVLFSFKQSQTNYFEISKNLDIFATVFREVNTYYVDDVDAGKMMKTAINEMLESLDPYTNFISEAEAEDFRFQMTGQYGGIGSLVGTKNNQIVITEPYEGFPAQKADIRAGDIIIEIEGKSTKGKTVSDISKLLKGQPGTQVKLVIERIGEGIITKTLTREEIQVKNVPYYGMINENIGYIKLGSFTQQAGQEVKDAMIALKKNPSLKGVILDVRGNPGGLLHESINIVNVFIEQGQKVVFTKGKVKEWDKEYKTLNQPVDLQMPLVVLTNKGSASASEIVSGSIQDLDRGVVLGQKTFGKGLVQSTRPLVYNTQLKVTTAKYYTPSGRCIQALDYSHRNADGSVGAMPDSLKKAFKTKNGRVVYDGGGIDPDVEIKPIEYSKIAESLLMNQLIFDYATLYRSKHNKIVDASNFNLTEADFDDFKKFIADKKYEYQTATEKALEEFKKKAESEKYYTAVKSEYEKLKAQLQQDKQSDLDKHKTEILLLLELEICKRYYFQKATYERMAKQDKEVIEAISILNNTDRYKQLLQVK